MNGVIKGLTTQQSILFLMRLQWQRDNHPEYLLGLYEEGTLQKEILNDIEKAQDHYAYLIDQGIDENIASEIRTSLLAPAEGLGMREVPRIPEKVWRQICRDVTKIAL